MNDFDVIIVGAGPGGSAAALFAVRAGLKTMLVDKASFPRDKICGDAISGKSLNILRKLNLIENIDSIPLMRADGVTFSSPKGESVDVRFRAQDPGETLTGYVCRRMEFDNFLFQTAKSEVHLCLENFNSTELIRTNRGVDGIRGKINGKSHDYHAKIIIGADGYKSFVARNLGLYSYNSEHTLVALRAYFENVSGLTDFIEIHFVKESLPGYFWIFPLNQGHANVGIGMRHIDIKKQNIVLHQVLDSIIHSPAFAHRFKNAKLTQKIKGWNLPTGSIFRPNHSDKVLLIGDAAGLIDPFTGEGIGNAMTSAEIAVRVAKQAIKENNTSKQRLSQYDALLKQELGSELKLSYRLQKIGTHFPFLLNLVIGKAGRNQQVAKWISSMIADEKSKQDLTSPLTYLKLVWA